MESVAFLSARKQRPLQNVRPSRGKNASLPKSKGKIANATKYAPLERKILLIETKHQKMNDLFKQKAEIWSQFSAFYFT